MQNEKIIEQIKTITEKTKEGKVSWQLINPNYLRWVRQDGLKSFVFTLQLQPTVTLGGQHEDSYFFTIQVANPNEVILQINSATEIVFRDSLKELFREATTISKNVKIEVIDKILKGLE